MVTKAKTKPKGLKKPSNIFISKNDGGYYYAWPTAHSAHKGLKESDYDDDMIGDDLCNEIIKALNLFAMPKESVVELNISTNLLSTVTCPKCKGTGYN